MGCGSPTIGLLGAEISSGEQNAIDGGAVAMVEAAEDWYTAYGQAGWRLSWREPFLTSRRLQAETAIGPPFIVAHVFAQQPLGLAFVPHEQVVEAVAPKHADYALAVRVGSRRSRWREKRLNTQTAHTTLKGGAIDAITIVQEEPWR